MSLRERRRQGFQHAAARRRLVIRVGSTCQRCDVSTRSRPKAAGAVRNKSQGRHLGFNTQPPEGGWGFPVLRHSRERRFQHAAARRRLARCDVAKDFYSEVSTRSRPKAAGTGYSSCFTCLIVSTRSRPKAAGSGVKFKSIVS